MKHTHGAGWTAALLGAAIVAASGCGPGHAIPTSPQASAANAAAAADAIGELREGRFESAVTLAGRVLQADPGNAHAALVRAVAAYRIAASTLYGAVLAWIGRLEGDGAFDLRPLHDAFDAAERALGAIDDDLATAARDPQVSLELCLACWRVDWNRSGRIEESDERLFEIEVDGNLDPLPPRDPRRRPTFRFDVGDVDWARAMVAFQRAAIDLGLAYSWADVGRAVAGGGDPARTVYTIRLEDAARVHAARDLLLAGLDAADRARTEYLAETDDDREWVPNPAQHDHPLPLPVDQALYDTWARVVDDVRKLVRGEEGIDVAEVARLGEADGTDPPQGFIDVGRLLEHPADIVLNLTHLDKLDDRPTRTNAEMVLRDLCGAAFVPAMAASPLPQELERMRDEIDRGAESFERKLRYMLWIN